jgi:hypothetical protein
MVDEFLFMVYLYYISVCITNYSVGEIIMNNQEKSKTSNLRQKLLMVYHEDGILDMVVGVSLLMLTAVMGFDLPALIGLIGIPLIMYIPIKDSVSTTRIGMIRFESQEVTQRKMHLFLYSGIGALLATSVFALVLSDPSSGFVEIVGNNLTPIFAVLLGGSLFAAGRILNNVRFVVYAIIGAALVLGLYSLGVRIWPAVAVVAVLMESIGITKLLGFLRSYSKKKGE